jgi:RNA polymerase sigma-70 factor (ECF subfamily)
MPSADIEHLFSPRCQDHSRMRVMATDKPGKRRNMSQYLIAIPSFIRSGGTAWTASSHVAEDRDALLFEQHLAGDDVAFVELFNRHNHRLYLYCLKMVGSAEAAEDLTQELWEKVIRLRFNEAKSVHNPGGFFVRMARNLSLNHIRDRRRLSPLDGLPESALPVDATRERTEREELVVLALARLPFDYREVLILHNYSGYSLEEIASMLDKSVDAIWKRASRAREKLRKEVMTMMEEQNSTMQQMSSRRPRKDGGNRD